MRDAQTASRRCAHRRLPGAGTQHPPPFRRLHYACASVCPQVLPLPQARVAPGQATAGLMSSMGGGKECMCKLRLDTANACLVGATAPSWTSLASKRAAFSPLQAQFSHLRHLPTFASKSVATMAACASCLAPPAAARPPLPSSRRPQITQEVASVQPAARAWPCSAAACTAGRRQRRRRELRQCPALPCLRAVHWRLAALQVEAPSQGGCRCGQPGQLLAAAALAFNALLRTC